MVTQLLQERIATKLGAFSDDLHMVDGLPMPTCKFARAHFSRIFKGLAAYGYVPLKKRATMALKDILPSALSRAVLIKTGDLLGYLTRVGGFVDATIELMDAIQNKNWRLVANKPVLELLILKDFLSCDVPYFDGI